MSDYFMALSRVVFNGMWGNGYSYAEIIRLQNALQDEGNQ